MLTCGANIILTLQAEAAKAGGTESVRPGEAGDLAWLALVSLTGTGRIGMFAALFATFASLVSGPVAGKVGLRLRGVTRGLSR